MLIDLEWNSDNPLESMEYIAIEIENTFKLSEKGPKKLQGTNQISRLPFWILNGWYFILFYDL